MYTKEELIDMFYDNICLGDWEEYDFVDPPYCWSVGASITVEGYEFEADAIKTFPDDIDVQSLEVTTPDGETISLI